MCMRQKLSETALPQPLLESIDAHYPGRAEKCDIRQLGLTNGESLPYLRLNEGVGARPLLWFPGFTESVSSQLPFAVAMASLGHDITIAGQSHMQSAKDATAKQANAMTQLATTIFATDETVDIGAHSYGSIVATQFVETSHNAGTGLHSGSRVVFTAPSGMNKHETLPKLARRFVAEMKQETEAAPPEFVDPQGVLMRRAVDCVLQNPRQALREVRAIAGTRINLAKLLMSGVASVAVVPFRDDKLFSWPVLEKELGRQLQFDHDQQSAGFCSFTPISYDGVTGAASRGIAHHNDISANPNRLAEAIHQYLSQE